VAPPAPRLGHRLLRCPICWLDLTVTAGALACRNRHSFDVAREGYVNLLRAGRRPAAAGGDGPDQLRHRAVFLGAGYFDALAATVARHLETAVTPRGGRWRVVDAGSGTGQHLARLDLLLGGRVIGLGLDISKAAIRQAAGRSPASAFAVADLWAAWPVRDRVADLVLNAFAPKNFAEMARVLRPGGALALVYPGPRHLAELEHRFGLLSRHARKAERYRDAAERAIGPVAHMRIVRRIMLDAAAVRDAILMGPSARHLNAAALDTTAELLAVTVDLAVLLAVRRNA
jgi:23S rRNA (guanine745-N1)-methyltransferase